MGMFPACWESIPGVSMGFWSEMRSLLRRQVGHEQGARGAQKAPIGSLAFPQCELREGRLQQSFEQKGDMFQLPL